jgi:hypothetical protein
VAAARFRARMSALGSSARFVTAAALAAALACSRPAPPPGPEPVSPTVVASATLAFSAAAAATSESLADPLPPRVPGPAKGVHDEDGNLVVTTADGRSIRLTSTGDLYLAELDGSAPEVLVRDDPARSVLENGEYPWLSGLTSPEFFPDWKHATISVPDGRGEAILDVDIASKRVRWINSAFGWKHVLVPRGPYAGDLILYKHRYYVGKAGTYDQCWLVDGRTGTWKINLTSVDHECDDSPAMRARLRY